MKSIFKILLAPVLWLAQACSPIGDPLDKEVSNSHYYNRSKTDIIYSPMGNWFELGKSTMNADVNSFRALNNNFGKDKDHVYFESYIVEHPDIDVSSFFAKEDLYMTHIGFDKNSVYTVERIYKNGKGQAVATVIPAADPLTFKQIDFDWGKDAQHHFYRYATINVDYGSFKNLSSHFSIDAKRVYNHYNAYFATIEADATTFKILGDSDYAYDDDTIYRLAFTSEGKKDIRLVKIPYEKGIRPKLYNSQYLRCGSNVYYNAVEIKDADADSFEIVSERYAKDATYAYFEEKIIVGGDVTTFQLDKDGFQIHDKNGNYRNGELIDENQALQ